MKFDNQLRRSLEQIIFNMHHEYDNAVTWTDWGLLDILEYVENERRLQGRDDHDESAFCIFRLWWANRYHIRQHQMEHLEKYLWGADSAIVDLYIAAYHVDDERRSTVVEGRRGILTPAGKQRLQEIAVKIIAHPEGVFEGPEVDRYNFTSALEAFENSIHEYDANSGFRQRHLLRARGALREMRIFIEVDKKVRETSNRYWGKYGKLEKYVDHDDREIRERIRELLGILQTPPFVNMRPKPAEEAITKGYYTDGDRTDVDENGELIDWAKTGAGIYDKEGGPAEEEDDDDSFGGLGSLFG